jgi:hypothetical protein
MLVTRPTDGISFQSVRAEDCGKCGFCGRGGLDTWTGPGMFVIHRNGWCQYVCDQCLLSLRLAAPEAGSQP